MSRVAVVLQQTRYAAVANRVWSATTVTTNSSPSSGSSNTARSIYSAKSSRIKTLSFKREYHLYFTLLYFPSLTAMNDWEWPLWCKCIAFLSQTSHFPGHLPISSGPLLARGKVNARLIMHCVIKFLLYYIFISLGFSLQQKQQQISSNVNSVQSNAMNGNNISSRATSSERQLVERRLALLNRDIDQKRGAIKNIRLSLQQTNVSE